MDGLWDSSWLKLLVPLILFLLFSLPDVLRKKRKYPSNRKRKEQQRKQEQTRPTDTVATTPTQPEPEPLPDIAKPRRAPQPVLQPEPAPAPVVTVPRTQPAAVPAVPLSVSPAVAVTHLTQGEAWESLSAEGRDIYAGIIWSELLEPPLALRQKRR